MQVVLNGLVVETESLPYRQGTIGIIVDDNLNFLIVQMVDYGENDWRFAGGGIDDGEAPEVALLRELGEELRSDSFEIIRRSSIVNTYDWPSFVIEKRFAKRGATHRGQQQVQFLVKFTGDPATLDPDPDELKQIKWVSFDQLRDHFNFPNQWEQAREVIKELLNI